jgi:hypothetical protein
MYPSRVSPGDFLFVIARERSDEAIQFFSVVLDCFAALAMTGLPLRREPQHLLQPRDLRAIGRIGIGQPVERRTIKHKLQLAQIIKSPLFRGWSIGVSLGIFLAARLGFCSRSGKSRRT